MINWDALERSAIDKIRAIMQRTTGKVQGSWIKLEMDITAAYLAGEVDLDALLESKERDFLHDVCGIRRHIDRGNGKLKMGFAPRCGSGNGQDGFTIAEVMMGMVICAITLLAVMAMYLATVKNNTTGNMVSQANFIARQKIEQVQGRMGVSIAEATTTETQGPYTIVTAITPFNNERSKRISVTVTWTKFNRPKRLVVSAISYPGNTGPKSWDDTDWEAWKDQFGVQGIN